MKNYEKSIYDLIGFADIIDCKNIYNIKGGLTGITCSGAYPDSSLQTPETPLVGDDDFPSPREFKPSRIGPVIVYK